MQKGSKQQFWKQMDADLLDGVQLFGQVDFHLGIGPPGHLNHQVEHIGLATFGPENKKYVISRNHPEYGVVAVFSWSNWNFLFQWLTCEHG